MKHIRLHIFAWFAAGLATSFAISSARAADPIFPKAARVGLVPLEGLIPAKVFPGFEATDQHVRVVVTELPKEAFASVDAAFNSNQPASADPKLEKFVMDSGNIAYLTHETAVDEGTNVRRFSLLFSGATFSGYIAVQMPDNDGAAYSEAAVRKMLASATLRKDVPFEEQLERLPFKVTELGSFTAMRTLTAAAGPTILLTDATDDENLDTAPYMLIGIMANGPKTPDDRDRFAYQIAAAMPGLRNVRITSSEPMRIDGAIGHETRLDAVTGKDNTPVTIVQWLRFGGGSRPLRIVAGAKRTEWLPAFARFRAVRDGIAPR